jgi:hypothetical protein
MIVAGVGVTTGFYVMITFVLPIFFKSILVTIIKYIQLHVIVAAPAYLWFI